MCRLGCILNLEETAGNLQGMSQFISPSGKLRNLPATRLLSMLCMLCRLGWSAAGVPANEPGEDGREAAGQVSTQQSSRKAQTTACDMPAEHAVHAVQIGLERSRLLELEEKAGGLQGKISTQRKAMGGVNAARESNIQVIITIVIYRCASWSQVPIRRVLS